MTSVAQVARRRLLPGGRLAGPMPWVIAIMTFLTVLAVATGLSISQAARASANAMAGKVTIQIVEANPDLRAAQRQRLVTELGRLTNVRRIDAIDDATVRDLLTPWLGEEGLDAEVPVPALIDATLADASPRSVADLTAIAQGIAPTARIDRHSDWLGPLSQLFDTLLWLAFGLIALMAVATAATVVLGARAALDQHRDTIDVMHLMGATDRQIAQLFERGVALDAISGSAMGFIVAIGVLIIVGTRVMAVDAALLGGASIGVDSVLAIGSVPFLVTLIAVLTARVAVLRTLAKHL